MQNSVLTKMSHVIGMYMVAMSVFCCGVVFVMRCCVVVCIRGAVLFGDRSHSGAALAIKRDWLVLAWLHSPEINQEVDVYEGGGV